MSSRCFFYESVNATVNPINPKVPSRMTIVGYTLCTRGKTFMRAAGPHKCFSPRAYKTNHTVILEGPFRFLSEVVS